MGGGIVNIHMLSGWGRPHWVQCGAVYKILNEISKLIAILEATVTYRYNYTEKMSH